MNSSEAYQYLRLLWKPKKGHRVKLHGKKYQIEKVVEGKGVKVVGLDAFFYPSELTWRPTPNDFNAVLLELKNLWIYRELVDPVRFKQQVAIKLNRHTVPLRGYPHQILNQVLNLRSVDSALSLHINKVFEKANTKGGGNVRIRGINTKDSSIT